MKISSRDYFRVAIVVASVRNFPASAASKLTVHWLPQRVLSNVCSSC